MLRFDPEPAGADPRYLRLRDACVDRSLTALLESPRGPIDVERLAGIVALDTTGVVERTPFQAIGRVRPGVAGEFDGRHWHYARAAPTRPAGSTPSRSSQPGLLRDALKGAVGRAMGNARRVAVFGGGGVDSSVILALANEVAKERGSDVVPIALDCGGPGDDRPHLAVLAKALGLKPVLVPPALGGGYLRSAFLLDSAPCPWPSSPYDHALAFAAKDVGAEVALDGTEGDFIFGGVPAFDAAIRREGLARSASYAATFEPSWGYSKPRRVFEFLVRPALVDRAPRALRAAVRRRRILRRVPWAGRVLRAHLMALADEVAPRFAPERQVYFMQAARFAEIAALRVGLERLAGIRFAQPLMDAAVLDFVAALEPYELAHNGRLRGLLRESVRGLVPDSVRLRPDKFEHEGAMLAAVEAGGGFAALRDLASVSRCADLGLVEPKRFEAEYWALANDPLGEARDWSRIWSMLSVEAFLANEDRADGKGAQ